MLKEINEEIINLSNQIQIYTSKNAWDMCINNYERLRKKFKDANLPLQATLTLISIASAQKNQGQIEKAANTVLDAAVEFEKNKELGYAFKSYQRALKYFETLNDLEKIDLIQEKINSLGMLDLVIVTDSTGSMGTALDAIKKEIAEMLYMLSEKIPGVRVGALTYRDHCDENSSYLIKAHPFTEQSDYIKLISFIKKLTPGGGGDIPEALEDALNYLQKGYEWENIIKVVILIADAPPHEVKNCPKKLDWIEESKKLANDRIKVYTVLCGGDETAKRTFTKISKLTEAEFFQLSNIPDLPALIVAIALHQVKLVEDFIIELEEKGKLTDSIKELLYKLKR